LIERPAKIQSAAGRHVQVLKCVQTNITDVKHPGISIGPIMTARPGPKGHPIRIAQSQTANARLRGARVGGIEERIARKAVDGVGQVNIPVLAKVRMKSETEQSEVAPATYFLADVQQWRG